MLKGLVRFTCLASGVVLSTIGGCTGSAAGRGNMEPTVEPLTEVEFDAFTTEIAEQIVAWLERGQVSLPVTITPPKIEQGSIERGGVAKAFCRRLADGLGDRLLGAVRFGKSSASRPRLRCGISFSRQQGNEATRQQGSEATSDPGGTVTFRLWDADSNLEICRGSYDYQRRPRDLAGLRRQLDERHLAARTPRGEVSRQQGSEATRQRGGVEAASSGAEPIAAGVQPAGPEAVALGGKHPARRPDATDVAGQASAAKAATSVGPTGPATIAAAPVDAAHPESGDQGRSAEQVAVPPQAAIAEAGRADRQLESAERVAALAEPGQRVGPGDPALQPEPDTAEDALPDAMAVAPPTATATVGPSAEVIEKMRLAERRMPPRRTLRIDRHAHGLAELVQEQAVYFADRMITDELGKLIFLDRRAWEGMGVEVRHVRRSREGRFSIELLVQARGRPVEVDVRAIYLDAQGRQVEVSAPRTYEFSPSYAKHIALHSRNGGAAEYIVLVSRG